MQHSDDLISIIIPIRNGAFWIKRCFDGILKQSAIGHLNLEICICNDSSTDCTCQHLYEWKKVFEKLGINFKIYKNNVESRGVGYSKNRAVSISSGNFLCFQDIDDLMLPDRIMKQYQKALLEPHNTIVGCRFRREPKNSTIRYTKWANSLTEEQLSLQVFTSHGPTVIMPTWFCHRIVYQRVGGFCETNTKGCPEDLIFFNTHLNLNGRISRVDETLLIYTYHSSQTTFSINKETIWNLRLKRLEQIVLSNWRKFTIWNAGKQGRKLYNSLSAEHRDKVIAFCDVDHNKIGRKYTSFNVETRTFGKEIDIIHFSDALPPFDLTDGVFENNLKTLNLKEGTDYVMFS